MFRILIADEAECCTAQKTVLKEDAHLILGVYVLINDDEHGEDEITKQLHDVSESTVLNIRFFVITFLDKVLYVMGCKHPVPYYFTDSTPSRGKNGYGHCDGVNLTREIFTELALET